MDLAENQECFAAPIGTPDSSEGANQASFPQASSFWPLLSLLFAASGCAALIYEIVWFQMLQLVIGSTAVSLAVLLSSFMGGMCLGSVALARVIDPGVPPLRVWALLELGIGLLGMLVYLGLPWLGKLYAGIGAGGSTGILLRAVLCSVCLLPPTLLMGATLPTISRLIGSDRSGMAQLGFVYGANTLGGMFGALLTGFVLLRIFNTFTAISVAVGINLALALLGAVLKTRARSSGNTSRGNAATSRTFHLCRSVYVVIAMSGFSALAAEVIWTRLLSLMLGSTTYTFSIILGVFLLGLALGNSIGTFVGRQSSSPSYALGVSQLLLVVAVGWAAFMLAVSLPYWPLNPGAAKSVWLNFQVDLLRCLWALLPATCLWGASFPLALASAAQPGQDPARLVGGLYAANTLGGIAGAVGASVFLIGSVGTQRSQQLLMALSAMAAALALGRPVAGLLRSSESEARKGAARNLVWWFVAGVAAILLIWSVPPVP